ncbi:MAG: Cph2 [Candidatus Jorgensenbacteria bacterium GW2011_GWA1_48_13]|uniref:Cph2 n=2 Tax=Candidatus Joergenseniibacteriota TaxID=1752739 RepID=A0A0G1W8C9_9BACT|nr:MAG: Cph2 [Candidatus Jorgensenbacteria bacterium GW2011_GWA1_48_13]KKU98594.1 MAG: diguanylate cyclase [Candidatus Jorgensenbacteria bacterium GW2011_GWC1_48_8]KKW15051.1 MAG: Cph2 [Candidatus Jorgensenbacteria bacterium GW2011_GWB1_50_10]
MPKRKENYLQTIWKLRAEVRRLKELAVRDELTGLLNRRGFNEFAAPFLKAARVSRSGVERRKKRVVSGYAVVIFDLDRFKRLNTTHGHRGGDAVLQAFAHLLLERVSGMDLVARWGGEEFVLLFPGASAEDAYRIAEEIRKKVERMFVVWHARKSRGRGTNFTVSAGVADFSIAFDFDDVLGHADGALFRAKKEGRNCVVVYGRDKQSSLQLA